MKPLDANKSRPLEGGPSFPLRHRVFRFLWGVTWLALASWTPPQCHQWRGILLRLFGAKVHPTARVYGTARVWYPPNLTIGENSIIGPRTTIYCMDQITIGSKVVISQGAYLCGGTHNISDSNFQLVTRPIEISDWVWIAADGFVGPGVTVHEGAVVGARGVLFKDAEAYGVYVGNPAVWVKQRVLNM